MSTSRSAAGLASLALLLALAAAAAAQPAPFGLGSDLRLQGIIEPADGANTLGTIKVRADTVVRRFGVVRAQTARAEGMSLFDRTELRPVQLVLVGSKEQLAVFLTAAPGTTLRMLGRYQGDNYLLAEISAGDATTPAGP